MGTGNSPVSEDRCGVPRLISRLPIFEGDGPLLLSLRGLCAGLDTLPEFWTTSSLCKSMDRLANAEDAAVVPSAEFCLSFVDKRRRLSRPVEEEPSGIPGKDGVRWSRCEGCWGCDCCWSLGDDLAAEEVDGDPGFDGNDGPTDMDVDLRLLRSPFVG